MLYTSSYEHILKEEKISTENIGHTYFDRKINEDCILGERNFSNDYFLFLFR